MYMYVKTRTRETNTKTLKRKWADQHAILALFQAGIRMSVSLLDRPSAWKMIH